MNEPLGIWKKYTVQRGDGTPVTDQSEYFVLKFTDAAARVALREYATHIRRVNPILARELIARCDEYDYQTHLANHNGRNGNGAR